MGFFVCDEERNRPLLSSRRKSDLAMCLSLFVFVLLICGVIILTILMALDDSWKPTNPPIDPVKDKRRRVNCFPDRLLFDITKEECRKRGCMFDKTTSNCSTPTCYMHPQQVGYKVVEVRQDSEWFVSLLLAPLSNIPIFEPPILNVSFKAKIWDNNHLEIKIEDATQRRYEVPFATFLKKDQNADRITADCELEYTKEPFHFKIKRKKSGSVLFDTSLGGFVFSDRFLQLATVLPSKNLYGIGEIEHPSLRHDLDDYTTWSLFASEKGAVPEKAIYDTYGTHPFYMVLEDDGKAHGVLLLNSNAMEYALIPAPGVIIRTLGGIFDFFISTGPKPGQVIQQNNAVIGRPVLPPYWSLGFHLCRWGHKNLTSMKAAVDRTRKAGIPLDVIHADIDHFDEWKVFTIGEKFRDLPRYYKNELRENGMRLVIILNPAIPRPTLSSNASSFLPWAEFSKQKRAFIEMNRAVLYGKQWPDEPVAYPDFFLNTTQQVWISLIVNHSKKLPFDGLWLELNEPLNWPNDTELICPRSDYENPEYRTWSLIGRDDQKKISRLSDNTLCMEAVQSDGKQRYRHYDVHNLYGWSQTPPTLKAIRQAYPGKRGFVLARSTFPGSGHYAAHFLGSTNSTWQHMARSIVGLLDMTMFGLPHTGADICGFWGNTTAELCLRWMQLGAFYPFSRNHNERYAIDQDPGVFGDEVAKSSAYYMKLRYRHLPYLYTQFYHSNQEGSAVARPVFFEFPHDNETWGLDTQFMFGPSFMVAPILRQNESSVTAFVPQKSVWVNLAQKILLLDNCNNRCGKNVTVDVNGTLLMQRGGSIVPSQNANMDDVNITTNESRKSPITLTTVLNCDGRATGTLFWDDGESADTIENGQYLFVNYSAKFDAVQRLILGGRVISPNGNDLSSAIALNYDRFIFYGHMLKNRSIDHSRIEFVHQSKTTLLYGDKIHCEPSPESLTCSIDSFAPIAASFVLAITFTK